MSASYPQPQTPFVYEDSLLDDCATERRGCQELWQQYLNHYHLQDVKGAWPLFLESVDRIHHHNSQQGKHKVTLNHFSILPPDEWPIMRQRQQQMDGLESTLATSLFFRGGIGEGAAAKVATVALDSWEDIERVSRRFRVLQQSLPPQQEQRLLKHHKKHKKKKMSKKEKKKEKKRQKKEEKAAARGQQKPSQDEVVAMDTSKSGKTVRPSYGLEESDIFSYPDDIIVEDDDGSTIPTSRLSTGTSTTADPWERHLNWATTDNPDGVAIVHEPRDQGRCGSCWAITATGTLEGSAARNAAQSTFMEAAAALKARRTRRNLGRLPFLSSKRKKSSSSSLHTLSSPESPLVLSKSEWARAQSAARQSERSAIQVAQLSIQELLDCDVEQDQGCVGGNPLLSYYFIHEYGLTSEDRYPYRGEQGRCLADRVNEPMATVDQWGVLTVDDEANLVLALRHVGPVAVGVDGDDFSFLMYRSGIFDSRDCSLETPNHAMLLVGYGQEDDDDVPEGQEPQKYWIVRNSWGKNWGEEGYIRVRRENPSLPAGVCGIAHSPNIALGGSLLSSSPSFYSSFVQHIPLEGDATTTQPPPVPKGSDFAFQDAMVGFVMGALAVITAVGLLLGHKRRQLGRDPIHMEASPFIPSTASSYGSTTS